MEEKTVLAIAAEDEATREKRIALKAKMAAIKEARDSCTRLAMRKELRTVSFHPQRLQVYSEEADDAMFSTVRMNQTIRKRALMKRS
jgi:hypothetical protein